MFDKLSIMSSFFAEFVHTDNGVTCSDMGFMDLSTAQECSSTVSYAKSFNAKANYENSLSQAYYPKGCFILDIVGNIYFNTHSTGKRESRSTSICKKGST